MMKTRKLDGKIMSLAGEVYNMEERLKAEISKTNEKLDDVNQNLSIKINDVQQDLNEFKIKN